MWYCYGRWVRLVFISIAFANHRNWQSWDNFETNSKIQKQNIKNTKYKTGLLNYHDTYQKLLSAHSLIIVASTVQDGGWQWPDCHPTLITVLLRTEADRDLTAIPHWSQYCSGRRLWHLTLTTGSTAIYFRCYFQWSLDAGWQPLHDFAGITRRNLETAFILLSIVFYQSTFCWI